MKIQGTADESQQAVIVANAVTKSFGDETAVRELSMSIDRGTIFGLIGPSGCGKTTSVRLFTGVYRPTSGNLEVLGVRPRRFHSSVRRRIGYMPQLFALFPDLTVWENLNFAASIYGMGPFRRKKLNRALELVELNQHRHKLARNISGGMQRRLSLAATLVHEPELIFLDEPTAGVDPVLRKKFWDYFRQLHETGRTLFVTTQYVSEAAYCDLVGVMNSGRLLYIDTPLGLRKRAFGGDLIELRLAGRAGSQTLQTLADLPQVSSQMIVGPNTVRLAVDDAGEALPAIIEATSGRLQIQSAEQYFPPFDEVFLELMRQHEEEAGQATA